MTNTYIPFFVAILIKTKYFTRCKTAKTQVNYRGYVPCKTLIKNLNNLKRNWGFKSKEITSPSPI